VQSLEDTRYQTSAIPGAEIFPEDAGDAMTGPDLTREAMGLGTVPEEVG
jgi:hypothetical protein